MTQDTGSSSGTGIGKVLLALGLVAASLLGGYLLISAPSGEDPKLALDPPQDPPAVAATDPEPGTGDQLASENTDNTEVQTTAEQDPKTNGETAENADSEEEATGVQEAETPSNTPIEPAEPELQGPSFDVVRVDSAGNAVVAGQAEAGQTVHILIDDEEVHSTTVDSGGGFVGLFELPPSADGRALTIEVEDSGGERRAAAATALVSPFGTPDEVATIEVPDKPAEVAEPLAEPVEPDATAVADAEATEPAEQPTILIVDEDGARPAQSSEAPKAPKAPDRVNVVIDTISYDAKGDVVLVGRALQGALLRLYLNNSLWTSGEVPEAGVWQINLMDVDPGVYTLRVDELDDTGRVTSRFETPFQREAPEVAIAALSPEKPETPSRLPKPGAARSPTPASAPARHSAPKAAIVTVQPGFTLWGIANKRYGDGLLYVQVYEANSKQIKDPDLIYPGQVFSLPED